jgi:hypothetical protein
MGAPQLLHCAALSGFSTPQFWQMMVSNSSPFSIQLITTISYVPDIMKATNNS